MAHGCLAELALAGRRPLLAGGGAGRRRPASAAAAEPPPRHADAARARRDGAATSSGRVVTTASRPGREPRDDASRFPTPAQVSLKTIAVVRSPHKERYGCPRQPAAPPPGGALREGRARCWIDFVDGQDHDFGPALQDLDGFEYVWVLSYLHLNQGWSPRVVPPRGPRRPRGLFATRAPHRPNHLALSACRLASVDLEARRLHVDAVDLLDGTPVLDVKPYVPYCDSFPGARAGWLGELEAGGSEEEAAT